MRRTHLRGHPNILKRLLIHVAGFNLGLLMRSMFGIGKPRALQDAVAAGVLRFFDLIAGVSESIGRLWKRLAGSESNLVALEPQTATKAAA